MPGISGFIDYNEQTGEPYMGIVIEDTISRVSIFISNRENAPALVKALTASLTEMSTEIRKMPNKLVVAEGVPNGAFRNKKV